jgi:DNA-binding CsgD family transcriptional regulator
MSKPLTPKEERIIALVAEGLPNKDIAGIVGTPEYGVKNDLKTIFHKTGTRTRVQLALWYVKGNLIHAA